MLLKTGTPYRFASALTGSSLDILERGLGDGSTMATHSAFGWRERCGRCQPWLHQPAPHTAMRAGGLAVVFCFLEGGMLWSNATEISVGSDAADAQDLKTWPNRQAHTCSV